MGAGHFQLCWLFALPWLTFLLIGYIEVAHKLSAAGWLYGGAFSFFLPLSFFTAFYVSWFFVFYLLIVGLLALGWWGPKRLLRMIFGISTTVSLIAQLATFAVIAAVMFVPFLVTYLPVLADGGGRGYPPLFSPTIPDLINVGPNNFLLGAAVAWVFAICGWDWRSLEAQFGFPPVISALFLVTLYLYARDCVQSRFGQRSENAIDKDLAPHVIFLVSVGILLSAVLVMTINGHSLWWFVYNNIPGAKAIRVTTRFFMILSFAMLVVAMFGFNRLLQRFPLQLVPWSRIASLFGERMLVDAMSMLAVALVFEQVARFINSELLKREQLALFQRVFPAPRQCRISFLSNVSRANGQPSYALQTDMMLISALQKVPTLNGYSGRSPSGWSMDDPRASDYFTKVALWLAVHGLQSQACGLDLETGKWDLNISARLRDALSYRLGDVIDFRTGGNSSSYAAFGWHAPEPTGRWTNGRRAVLMLNPGNSSGQLVLLAKLIPLVTPSSPDLRIAIVLNGFTVAQETLTTATDLAISIDASVLQPGASLRLDFLIENPKTPAELGLGNDTRSLGLMVTNLTLKPSK